MSFLRLLQESPDVLPKATPQGAVLVSGEQLTNGTTFRELHWTTFPELLTLLGAEPAGSSVEAIADLRNVVAAKADLIGGTIPSSQLPALVKTDVFVINSQPAMLALTAQSGDIAIRSDLTKTYVHNGGTSGTVLDWSELVSPTDAVTSVNGLIGAIVLGHADVGAAAAVHTHTLSQITDATAALAAKYDKSGGTLTGNSETRHAGGGNSGPGTSWGPAANPTHGLEARWISSGQSRLQVTGPNGCNLDFEAVPLDGNGFANIRFNRGLNTTGSMAVQVFAGDGTSTVVGQISKGNSFFGITGNVGFGTNTPATKMDVNSDSIRIRHQRSPASNATGFAGEFCHDANYIYVCVSSGNWKRAALLDY